MAKIHQDSNKKIVTRNQKPAKNIQKSPTKFITKKQKNKKIKSCPNDEFDELMLEIETNSISHEDFLTAIRSKCKKIAKKDKNGGNDILVKEYYLEKFCEICKKYNDE